MPESNLIRNRTNLGRDRTLDGRRVLDLAQGILIGFQRYRTEAAFEELVTVAHKHDVTMSSLAAAVVALATGTTGETDVPREALAVAELVWGEYLNR